MQKRRKETKYLQKYRNSKDKEFGLYQIILYFNNLAIDFDLEILNIKRGEFKEKEQESSWFGYTCVFYSEDKTFYGLTVRDGFAIPSNYETHKRLLKEQVEGNKNGKSN